MSNSPPALPAKQRRQNSSKPYLMVSFGSSGNDEHGSEPLNQGKKKRKPIHYRRDTSVGQDHQTGGISKDFDLHFKDSGNGTESSFDENCYETIKDVDSKKTDDTFQHLFSEPGESIIKMRRDRIKRWSIDKVEKNKRLSTTSSTSPSKKSFSDEDFDTEEDNSQLTSRKHGESSKYGPANIYQLILLVLAIASLTCVFVVGLLLIFKPQAFNAGETFTRHTLQTDSSIVMELEKVQDQMKTQEAQIKDLCDRLEERNSMITRLEKEFAHLKENFDYIIQNFQNIPRGRPDS